jgi:hypothetical protein
MMSEKDIIKMLKSRMFKLKNDIEYYKNFGKDYCDIDISIKDVNTGILNLETELQNKVNEIIDHKQAFWLMELVYQMSLVGYDFNRNAINKNIDIKAWLEFYDEGYTVIDAIHENETS